MINGIVFGDDVGAATPFGRTVPLKFKKTETSSSVTPPPMTTLAQHRACDFATLSLLDDDNREDYEGDDSSVDDDEEYDVNAAATRHLPKHDQERIADIARCGCQGAWNVKIWLQTDGCYPMASIDSLHRFGTAEDMWLYLDRMRGANEWEPVTVKVGYNDNQLFEHTEYTDCELPDTIEEGAREWPNFGAQWQADKQNADSLRAQHMSKLPYLPLSGWQFVASSYLLGPERPLKRDATSGTGKSTDTRKVSAANTPAARDSSESVNVCGFTKAEVAVLKECLAATRRRCVKGPGDIQRVKLWERYASMKLGLY
jgi:hypothetical protein